MHPLSFCVNDKLRICSWSNRIQEVTGLSSSVVIGEKYFDIVPRILSDKKDAVKESLFHNRPLNFKKFPIRFPKCLMKADIHVKPIKKKNGHASKVRVSIYPYAIFSSKEKIHEAQNLVEIGKIASLLAHGVRNPLNALKGAVVYLEEKYSSDETLVEFTSIMSEEICRLDKFISKFLTASISEPDSQETDINGLIKKIEIFTSLQTRSNNIEAFYEYGSVPPLKISPFDVEQAILNVINNAIEAMNSGGQLRIKTTVEERNDMNYAVIKVSDTGPGIESYTTDDLSLAKTNSGRGFGLLITNETMKCHNGHIEIKSKKNSGTTVKLYLPLEQMPDQ